MNILLLLLLPLITACTHQQLYQTVQNNRQNTCHEQPANKYDECMDKYSKPYDEYEKERQAILKN